MLAASRLYIKNFALLARGPGARPAKPRLFSSQAMPKKPTGIKALVKEYGYSALGVYLTLSALDLPVCYLLVHSMGKEEIERYENQVKQYFGFGKLDAELREIQQINKLEEEHQDKISAASEKMPMFSWFSWTEFAIAYGIHKSVFIFVRLPLTAAFTPTIVRGLRSWGFKIGTDRLATTASLAKNTITNTAASPRLGTRPTKKNKWFWFF
ncbi:hypothetical protein METBIDRAFT_10556 [Metschnikowia bicuspidata var. bicuspidata NRRL YB-4993]|uniref:DUF1279 domain-containing protein n=1 Tax=Metschnikowia bicuspidata var. bicuspidata NRRL YB-4993 TaxID=869754 RepID=A0A1A0HJR4_9ASCO|nr:hypothetical protein METBIDRAFT_10556 [Metschnikowia bicuspidata var. bicuspidata NRRL YB-4993]OBA24414.1 hypothetical protein METBIDRAFT_10556 [Metschnikowia bicuspidata var. bicuspidata NRRL YB-4993]